MSKTRSDIVNDLLRTANYYWHDDREDQSEPINPDEFDPVIDKIFKANAVELEKLYAEMAESHQAITLALAQTLVPDQSLLPEPGYTVAQIVPKAARLHTTPEDRYQMTGQSETGDKVDFYFTPLFEHYYPKCTIKAILTDNAAIQYSEGRSEIVAQMGSGTTTSSAWIGMLIDKSKPGDLLSFFVGNQIVDQFDKDYRVFQSGRWLLNGHPELLLNTRTGVEGFMPPETTPSTHLLDQLNIPRTYQQRVINRFSNSFIHMPLPDDWEKQKQTIPIDHPPELADELSIDQPLLWIKITFDLPLAEQFLIDQQIYPGCIPLVNRRLLDNYVVKQGYDRIVLPMRTNDLFLDVHRVRDAKEGERHGDYQKVDFLHPGNSGGTYLLRSSSRMRRLNREDASRQINRLLEVIQEEYRTFKEEGVHRLREDFEIIEKAINRIKSQLPTFFRDEEGNLTYYAMATFRRGATRIYYSYWETQGDQIRYLADRTGLTVSSTDVKIGAGRSVIPIQRGQGQLTPDDYLNLIRMTLSSGGKILTRADIENYCAFRYGAMLAVERIERKLMMLQQGQMGRGILVTVKPVANMTPATAQYIGLELQNELNAKSAFFTEIKVELNYEGNGA